MPVVFAGHGSPMNIIEDNAWSQGFSRMGQSLPEPRAILAISAHWYLGQSLVTAMAQPRTIHDFYGFPKPLYELSYPAPGDPSLAERVQTLLGAEHVALSEDWGLDHGSWSVLRWMRPEADLPVVQLSVNGRLPPKAHLALGKKLRPLRDEGVLILASGNLVHNLRDAMTRVQSGHSETPDWAERFDAAVAEALINRDEEALVAAWPGTPDGQRAHPSPDHWLPLLYAFGASACDDAVRFPVEGFEYGSLSMRSVCWGG